MTYDVYDLFLQTDALMVEHIYSSTEEDDFDESSLDYDADTKSLTNMV